MRTVIPTNAMVLAAPLPNPRPSRRGATCGEIWAAPKDAEKNPASVTPICTEERNLLESPTRRATRAPAPPASAMPRTWLSRRETRAISEAAKTPPTRTKRKTSAMSTTRSFIGSLWQAGSSPPAGLGQVAGRGEDGEDQGGDDEHRDVEGLRPGAEGRRRPPVRGADRREHGAQRREDERRGGHVDDHGGRPGEDHAGEHDGEHRPAPAATRLHGSEVTVVP